MLNIALYILSLITPVCMAVVGIWWTVKPPKIDHGFGYRTALSTRSSHTWKFAHYHISRLWTRLGILLSIVSVVLIIVLKANYQTFVLWVIGAQMVFLCISAFLVDAALKNSFDEDGEPVQK